MDASSKASAVEIRGDIILNQDSGASIGQVKHILLEKGTQVFTSNTETNVSWSENADDVGDWFDSGSATLATVPAGVEFVDIQVNFRHSNDDEEAIYHIRITKNNNLLMTSADVGVSVIYSNDSPYPAGEAQISQLNAYLIPVAEGDVLRVAFRNDQDVATNPTILADISSFLITAWPFKEGV